MARGQFQVEVPHFCGQLIDVTVEWTQSYGSRIDPPEYDEHHTYYTHGESLDISKCSKCRVNLFDDTLFQENIRIAGERVTDFGDDGPDGDDYEPDPKGFDQALWDSLEPKMEYLDKDDPPF